MLPPAYRETLRLCWRYAPKHFGLISATVTVTSWGIKIVLAWGGSTDVQMDTWLFNVGLIAAVGGAIIVVFRTMHDMRLGESAAAVVKYEQRRKAMIVLEHLLERGYSMVNGIGLGQEIPKLTRMTWEEQVHEALERESADEAKRFVAPLTQTNGGSPLGLTTEVRPEMREYLHIFGEHLARLAASRRRLAAEYPGLLTITD